jgi:hypothetical protein
MEVKRVSEIALPLLLITISTLQLTPLSSFGDK